MAQKKSQTVTVEQIGSPDELYDEPANPFVMSFLGPVTTLGGCVLTARLDGDTITLTDPRGRVARVTIADVAQSNGVVHVIDKVLLPAS